MLIGTNQSDVILGLGGMDMISAGRNEIGPDRVCGGDDGDIVAGGNGIDRIFGEGGDDFLNGNNGNDHIDGGDGFDICVGGRGDDTFANCEVVVP